jgi:hypothetical protein
MLERFHRRHPRAPRPQRVVLDQTYPVNDPPSSDSDSTVSPPADLPPPTIAAVPTATRRTPTPPPMHENLRSNYVAPTITTTRAGRASHPADCYDPVHVSKTRACRSANISALVLPPALEGG